MTLCIVDVDGVVFDLKHKVAPSSLPHGRCNSPGKEMVLAMIKEVKEGRPTANVFVRSHVHYFSFFETLGRIALTTPALQINSSYGQRQCSGIIDFGFLVCDVEKGRIIHWHKHLIDQPIKPERVIKL
jgi:hypothetical protein